MALIQVCDVCRIPGKSLTVYSVHTEVGSPVDIALCEGDDLLRELVEAARAGAVVEPVAPAKKAAAKKTTTPRKRVHRPLAARQATLEEIEAQKKA